MNILSDMDNRSLKTELLSFILLPFGDTNEISTLFGWGTDAHSSYQKTTKSLVFELCMNSNDKIINLWDVIVA